MDDDYEIYVEEPDWILYVEYLIEQVREIFLRVMIPVPREYEEVI